MGAPRHMIDPIGRVGSAWSVGAGKELGRLPDVELDRRVRAGAAVWEELLDRLTASGMLPSVELASQLRSFLGDEYWRAENARVEGLRRWVLCEAAQTQTAPVTDRSRGFDGR